MGEVEPGLADFGWFWGPGGPFYANSEVLLEHASSALIFALLFKGYGLPHSIMVVRQILVLFVEVRILVGQQVTPRFARGFVFSGELKAKLS